MPANFKSGAREGGVKVVFAVHFRGQCIAIAYTLAQIGHFRPIESDNYVRSCVAARGIMLGAKGLAYYAAVQGRDFYKFGLDTGPQSGYIRSMGGLGRGDILVTTGSPENRNRMARDKRAFAAGGVY